MDLTPILDVILGIVSPVLTACAVMGVKYLLAKTKLDLTAQQQATILNAAQTGAGMVTMALSKGAMGLKDVHVGSAQVQAAADYVMTMAPAAAAGLGVTQAGIAQMIVGKVGKAIGEDPTIPTVPVPQPTTIMAPLLSAV